MRYLAMAKLRLRRPTSRGRNAGSMRDRRGFTKTGVVRALENIADETNKSKEKRFVVTIVELNTDRVLF